MNSENPKFPIELCCQSCGSVVGQSFVSLKPLPLLYCTSCAAAIMKLKNHLCNREIYNSNLLVSAGYKQSSFGSKSFNAVFRLINDPDYFWKEYLNKSKENT